MALPGGERGKQAGEKHFSCQLTEADEVSYTVTVRVLTAER